MLEAILLLMILWMAGINIGMYIIWKTPSTDDKEDAIVNSDPPNPSPLRSFGDRVKGNSIDERA